MDFGTHISELLARYRKIADDHRDVVRTLAAVILEYTGITIPAEQIKGEQRRLTITCGQAERSEIFLHMERIQARFPKHEIRFVIE